MKWFDAISEHTVDGGNPLINAHNVTEEGVTQLAGDDVFTTGYSLVNAKNMDAAIAMAKGCPNGVHVYEALSM